MTEDGQPSGKSKQGDCRCPRKQYVGSRGAETIESRVQRNLRQTDSAVSRRDGLKVRIASNERSLPAQTADTGAKVRSNWERLSDERRLRMKLFCGLAARGPS